MIFKKPRALTIHQIEGIIHKFGEAAYLAQQTGFHGIQLHAAHGYLISQFLSPISNRRQDQYGGSLKNRSAFLFNIIKAVRQNVKSQFIVGVKINSADFQNGGFSHDECKSVIRWIDEDKNVDFVEISGGNYEKSVVFRGGPSPDDLGKPESTIRREAYFLEFGEEVRKEVKRVKLMVTGGFRRLNKMNEALNNGVNLIGLGRPFCVQPDVANELLKGAETTLLYTQPKSVVSVFWHQYQIKQIANGRKPNLNIKISKSTVFKAAFYDPTASFGWIYCLVLLLLLIAILIYAFVF